MNPTMHVKYAATDSYVDKSQLRSWSNRFTLPTSYMIVIAITGRNTHDLLLSCAATLDLLECIEKIFAKLKTAWPPCDVLHEIHINSYVYKSVTCLPVS